MVDGDEKSDHWLEEKANVKSWLRGEIEGWTSVGVKVGSLGGCEG